MPARDLRLTLPTARLTAIRFLPAFLAWFGLLVCPRLSTAQYSVSVDGTCDPVFYDPTYLSLDPNTTSGALEIGFPFTFFDVPYDSFYISANGFITFDPAAGSGPGAQFLPDPTNPNTLIAAAWGNLNGEYCDVSYETLGSAPQRSLHVNFWISGAGDPPCGSGYYLETQVILYESSNIIEIHTEYWDGGEYCDMVTTQGLENADGTMAVTPPGRNQSMWSAYSDYVAFIPESFVDLAVIDYDRVHCGGTQDIRILVQNLGGATVDTFYAGWTWNGVPQDTVPVYLSLPPMGYAQVSLGQQLIEADSTYALVAWTFNPENGPDHAPYNDTIAGNVTGGLSGTYTIGGTSPDYPTIDDAVDALVALGVCDTVTFAIRPGTYVGEIDIPHFTTLNASPVIFRSETGNADDVTITAAYNSSGSNRLVEITNASHLRFEDLRFTVTGNACANVFYITSYCTDIAFTDCELRGSTCTSTSTTAATILMLNGTKETIRLTDNLIRRGSYGVYIAAGSVSDLFDVEITGNTLDSNYRYGILLAAADSFRITGNTITSPYASAVGIDISGGSGQARIDANAIHLAQGTSAIRITGYKQGESPGADSLLLTNNMVSISGGTSGSRSVQVTSSTDVYAWHNTMHSSSAATNSYAAYFSNNTATDLRNSLATHAGAGRAAWLSGLTSDHNAFHVAVPPLIQDGNNHVTLDDWQAASGQDTNSLEVDPLYVGPTDLHVLQGALNGAGDALTPPVLLDIDGESRNLPTPDIGADEFGFLNDDLAAVGILFSNAMAVGENEVRAIVYNIGLNSVDEFVIQWQVNGIDSTPVTILDPIPAGDGDTILLGTVTIPASGPFSLRFNTHLPNGEPDNDMSNDTLLVGPVYPLLRGLYTVGGSDPDFDDLVDAFAALEAGGIIDSVAFSVRPGVYADPINLSAAGIYACDTPIRVFSETGDADDVLLTNTNQALPVLRLNGAAGLRFQHLTFQLSASAFHNAVVLENGATCNRFEDCVFIGRISTQTAVTYSTVYGNINQGPDNDFYRNTFRYGSHGLYHNGPSLPTGSLVDIRDNTFEANYSRGLFVGNSRGANITGNTIMGSAAQHGSYYGIIATNCQSMTLSHNTVFNPYPANGGISFSECNGTVTDTTWVYNNYAYVSVTNSLSSALGGGYSNYAMVVNNTARNTVGNASGFSWSSNFLVANNIFQAGGTGVAIEWLNMGSNFASENNCLYAPTGDIGEYQNVRYHALADWQALGFDTSSLVTDPLFDSTSHQVHSALLDGRAYPFGRVTDDLDGEPRDPESPDLGADEFTPASLDASLDALVYPVMPFPPGHQPVYVRFSNNGADTLTSLQFDWTVNGIAQPAFIWNGILAKTEVYDSLDIGTFAFEPYTPYTLRIWVSQPNMGADGYTANDTIEIGPQTAGLAGMYTIGGNQPDFETLTDAANALNTGGAAAPVTFNIRNGIYSEPIVLTDYPGSDCDRPVVFQSESGDRDDVIINNLGIDAHTIVLDGTDGVAFRQLTLTSINTAFRHVVLLSGGAHCNRLEDNLITGFESTSTAATSAVIRATAGLDTANVIIGNTIRHGSHGIYWTGNGSAPTHTRIEDNVIDPYYEGIYGSNVNGLKISGNQILVDNSTSSIGVELSGCHNLMEISGNRIFGPASQYGLYLSNVDNTADQRSRIYNNFISLGGTNIARGIYATGCAFMDILHNSVLVFSTNTTLANTTPLYLASNPSMRLYNNATRNAGIGYAIYANANSNWLADHNVYHTAGSTFAYWNGGATETTLEAWQTATGQDSSAIDADPSFMSNEDLHTFLVLLNGVAETGFGILTDIDGEVRDSLPDIGADEFDPLPLDDAGIFRFLGPAAPFAAGSQDVQVVLKNFGGNILESATIRWAVNGIEQAPYTWTGSLPTSGCDTLSIGTYAFAPLTAHIVDAWTEMPNDTADANPINDLFTTEPFYASLAGIYTVGGFAPDFNLISDLETVLNSAGIVDTVIFRFRPGTYTEPISVVDFPRLTSTDPVIFTSETGDSTDVVLTQNTNGTALIDLDDAHQIAFRHLTLRNLKGHVVQVRNGASRIDIDNNRLEGVETLSGAYSLVYSPNTHEDSIRIRQNVLHHGYHGIHMLGSTYEKGHVIEDNTFLGVFHHACYMRYFDGLRVTGNTFSASSTSGYDLYLYTGSGACTISNNRILSDGSNPAAYIGYIANTTATPTRVFNNYIQKSGTSTVQAMWIQASAKIDIDFNTIRLDNTGGNSIGLWTQTLTDARIRNNIMFSAAGPAHAHEGTLPTTHDHHAILSRGPVQVRLNSTNYATLAAFASATSTNANSLAVDPLFTDPTEPMVAQYQLDGAGLAIPGIAEDINGATRATPPDIGALEFTPLAHDVRMAGVIAPASGCGLSAAEPVTILLVNQGSADATGFDVFFAFDNQTLTANIGGQVVPAGDSLLFTFPQTINASAFGPYTLAAWHTYGSDLAPANDTLASLFTNHPPMEVPAGNLIPADGTTGLGNQVSLSWSPVAEAIYYDVYVWPETSTKPATPTHGGLTTITTLVNGLSFGTTYAWQVHAVNLCAEELPSNTAAFTTRFLPDLVVSSIVIPATGLSQQSISVEWVVTNQGQGATVPGTWFDNIYLSTDPTYNSFDPLLGSVPNLTALNAGQSYTHQATVTLPQGSNGNYYIIIRTDPFSGVQEVAENNNTSHSTTQIEVTLSPPPDLIVTAITTPAITFSGELLAISFTVRNNGSGITTENLWKDQVSLLPVPGNNNGTSATLSTLVRVGQLAPDSTYTVNIQVIAPANIFGPHQVRVFTDAFLEVFEFASEGNNVLFSPAFEIVLTPPVDLVPDSLVVPDTLSLYDTAQIPYIVRNNGGSAPARGWTDRLFMSPSPVYNPNFLTLLANQHHNSGLMPGDYNARNASIFPNANLEGTQYIYVVSDYYNAIDEYTFEGNNIIRSAPFTLVRPDLVPEALLHPASRLAGQRLTVSATLRNQGPGHLYGDIANRFYLSTDTILSTATDFLLTTRSLTNLLLAPGDSVTFNHTFATRPDQIGPWYLLLVTDAAQAIHENNDDNNILASAITLFEAPHPDLVPGNIMLPDTLVAGVNFSCQYTVANTGNAPLTQSVTDSLFLSFSPTWNRATATFLGTRGTAFLDTGGVVNHSISLRPPVGQNPNEYYLYVVSDATGNVYESAGESNNIARSGLVVLLSYPAVDLALTGIAGIPDTLTSGMAQAVTYTVANLSQAPTYYGAWTDRCYLSTDSILQPGDMLLGPVTYSGGIIPPGDTFAVPAILPVPHGISGDYYILLEADADDLQQDPDRTNNVNTVRLAGVARKIHIKLALYPDFEPSNFIAPVSVTSGSYFEVITFVTNAGPGSGTGRIDNLYASTNNVIDQGDHLLVTRVKPALSAGGSQADTLSVFVPANYSGNYFLIWSIDHYNQVYEYQGETNNRFLTSLVATPPPPSDLIVRNILVPDSILAGDTAMLVWETRNIGTNPASGIFREVIYLSTDTIWQVGDEVIGMLDNPIYLSPGMSMTRSAALPVRNVTNGQYHTLVRTDARNNIAESNEANNEGASYERTHVDIEEIFLDVPKETLLPAQVNRYYKLYIGADEAGRNVLLTLTGDSLLGVNQLFVKRDAVPTPADHDYAYEKAFSPHQRIILRGVEPGYYYVLVSGFKTGNQTPQAITLLARLLQMEILEVDPATAGNRGYATVEIIGSDLVDLTRVHLVSTDTTDYFSIPADTFLIFDEGTRVVARFNLEHQPVGLYDVQCIRAERWAATLENGFTITAGRGPDLQVNWDFNPKGYNPRFTTLMQIKVDVENRGDADVVDRFIRVGSPDYDNPVYYTVQDYYNDLPHPQLLLASEDALGFPGVLRPGGRRTFYVYGVIAGTQGFSIQFDK